MIAVKKTQFLNLFFDEQSKIIESYWNDGNEEMTEQDIKQLIVETADIIKTYSPLYFLADDSNRLFVYSVDIQNWIATTLAEACMSVGVKKFPIIAPKELLAQLSTEQTSDEAGEISFEIRYFNDKKTALEWIKS